MNTNTTHLQARAKALRLAGLLAHWDSLAATPTQLAWVVRLLDCEEQLRGQRSLERRMRAAHLQPFAVGQREQVLAVQAAGRLRLELAHAL